MAAGLALVLLAACGSSSNAAAVVRAAADKTKAAGSAHISLSVDFSASGSSNSVTGDGVVDLKNGRADISLDVGTLAGGLITGTVETILDSDGIFAKLPPGLVSASKPWVKLDLSSLASQAGVNLGSLGQLQTADPTQAIEFLKGALGDIHTVGTETLRGASTTHYQGTLDLNKAVAAAPAASQAQLKQAVASLGNGTIPADVWVDSSGRLRKLMLQVTTTTSSAAAGTVEFEMYDFGTAADVQTPPADQVTDLTNLFQGLPKG